MNFLKPVRSITFFTFFTSFTLFTFFTVFAVFYCLYCLLLLITVFYCLLPSFTAYCRLLLYCLFPSALCPLFSDFEEGCDKGQDPGRNEQDNCNDCLGACAECSLIAKLKVRPEDVTKGLHTHADEYGA